MFPATGDNARNWASNIVTEMASVDDDEAEAVHYTISSW